MNREVITNLYNDKLVQEFVDKKILDWDIGVMENNLSIADNELSTRKILHKIKHTHEVILVGGEIMDREKTIDWDKSTGITLCLLHDVGRFAQAHKKSFNETITGMDHAKLGVEMIKEQDFRIINIGQIIEAVALHSKRTLESNGDYVKFIRDADKTSILKRFKTAEHCSYLWPEQYPENGISQDYFYDFLMAREPLGITFKSEEEQYLFNCSWHTDLCFEATKKIWQDEKYLKMMILKIKELGASNEMMGPITRKLFAIRWRLSPLFNVTNIS